MSKSFHKRYLQKTKPNLDINLQQKNVLTKNRKEKKKMWHAYGLVCKKVQTKEEPDMQHALYMIEIPANMLFMPQLLEQLW